LEKQDWDLIIVDEAHYCKSVRAQRTKMIVGGRDTKTRKDLKPLSGRRWMFLTGTPIMDRPLDLWPMLTVLDPKGLGRRFWDFTSRYCPPRHTRWGLRYDRTRNLDELHDKLRDGIMIRRLKSEVLTELPAKRRQIIELPSEEMHDLLDSERRVYSTYRELLSAGHRGQAKRIKFTELTKFRQEVAQRKLPQVIEHLQDILVENPVVVFAYHRSIAEQIAKAFTRVAVLVTGRTPPSLRNDSVIAFQKGKANLFVGTIRSVGVGITLTRAQHVVFAELDWTPSVMTQAEDRCHRIGQTGSVLIQHLVLARSLDARMVKVLVRKQNVVTKSLDREITNV